MGGCGSSLFCVFCPRALECVAVPPQSLPVPVNRGTAYPSHHALCHHWSTQGLVMGARRYRRSCVFVSVHDGIVGRSPSLILPGFCSFAPSPYRVERQHCPQEWQRGWTLSTCQWRSVLQDNLPSSSLLVCEAIFSPTPSALVSEGLCSFVSVLPRSDLLLRPLSPPPNVSPDS